MSLVVRKVFFLNYNVQKENKYKTRKNPQDQVTFKWKSLMKNDPRKAI